MIKTNNKQSFLKDLYLSGIDLVNTFYFSISWLPNTNLLIVKNLSNDRFYKVDLREVFEVGNYYLDYFDNSLDPKDNVLRDSSDATEAILALVEMKFFQKENKTLKPDYFPAN